MQFTSGDLVALLVGSIGAIRWIADKFFTKSTQDDTRFQALVLDYEKFKAARAEIDKANAETLGRMERGISDVQSQIRLLVSGGASKFIELPGKEEH